MFTTLVIGPARDHRRGIGYSARVLVLASASPRRLELLRSAGIEPIVDPADVPEIPDPARSPVENAAAFARDKARLVATRHPHDVVLGADTVVIIDRLLLGKPAGADEAREMLRRLEGRAHRVTTCVTLVPPEEAHWPETSLAITTGVVFRPLGSDEIEGYIASGEWEGKAGAYAIQGLAAGFVRAVLGSYTNVVGLPLAEVIEELATIGLRPESPAPALDDASPAPSTPPNPTESAP